MLDEAVPVLALLALLVVAFGHPRPWVEAAVGVGCAAVVLPLGSSGWAPASEALLRMLPVVVFLAAILVVAAACADQGLFAAIGDRLGRGSPQRFLALTFVAAVAVTAVLSLDATVVLLTLVVLAAAGRAGVAPGPGLAACVRLANSSSLLLPVSNLTTLLALHVLPLSFGRFALVMAPSWAAVVGVEYAVHRWWFRADLARATPADVDATPARPLPPVPLTVLVVMLGGFAVAPLVGLSDAWGPAVVAVAAAVVLVAATLPRVGVRASVATVARESHPGFAVFVLALAVVVDAVGRGGLGDLVSHIVERVVGADGGTGLLTLLALAVIATVLANVLNNLPATLLLLPVVGPLGTVPLLATLVGLNVGSSLTWTGSLANLLWRRTLLRAGHRPGSGAFHALAAVAVPLGVLVGVTVLWLWAPVVLP